MSYFWLKYLHIVASLVFVGVHGASMVVFYAIRRETDRHRIQALLSISAKTVIPMYISMGLVVASGVWVGQRVGAFRRQWGWLSLGLLVVISVVMYLLAKPHHRRVLAACELRPSGVPRISDEELSKVLRSPQVHLVTAIGIAGLAALVYLMTFKPL
jgi:uncharacterized membrane protein